MRQRFGCRSQRAEPSSPTGLVPASRSKRPPVNGLVNRKAASKIGRGFFCWCGFALLRYTQRSSWRTVPLFPQSRRVGPVREIRFPNKHAQPRRRPTKQLRFRAARWARAAVKPTESEYNPRGLNPPYQYLFLRADSRYWRAFPGGLRVYGCLLFSGSTKYSTGITSRNLATCSWKLASRF